VNSDVAKKLSKLLKRTAEKSNMFRLIKTLDSGVVQGFHTFANGRNSFGGFLISNESETLWVLIIDWKDNDNYYLVLYPENNNQAPLAELHKEIINHDGSDLEWTYVPRKKDGKNEHRKHSFENTYGTLKAIVSLPNNIVTLEDTLNDLFHLAACRVIAHSLAENINSITAMSFPEGKRLEKKHYARERSAALVNLAKKIHSEKNDGNLPCDVCKFDFKNAYGERGALYIEAHHKMPLCELDDNDSKMTQVEDLGMVCANCHRMLHRRPWPTIEELKRSVNAL